MPLADEEKNIIDLDHPVFKKENLETEIILKTNRQKEIIEIVPHKIPHKEFKDIIKRFPAEPITFGAIPDKEELFRGILASQLQKKGLVLDQAEQEEVERLLAAPEKGLRAVFDYVAQLPEARRAREEHELRVLSEGLPTSIPVRKPLVLK